MTAAMTIISMSVSAIIPVSVTILFVRFSVSVATVTAMLPCPVVDIFPVPPARISVTVMVSIGRVGFAIVAAR